ncbi:MAG: hypothetical protein KIPDCIKN_00627 [Haliscomenobacter sp.]|jgi:WD40 repeat protein|nr:hypothetical protein [Haliscomenobacter sp.]
MRCLFLLPTILLAVLSLPNQLVGQCYQNALTNATQALRQKKYKEAINYYLLANSCEDKPPIDYTLSGRILDAQEKWEAELIDARNKAQDREKEALASQAKAEQAQAAETQARKEADLNAQRAREQGTLAEALRLSLLSNIEKTFGNKANALILAFLSRQLAGDKTPEETNLAFGEAIVDSLTEVIRQSDGVFNAILPNANGSKWLVYGNNPVAEMVFSEIPIRTARISAESPIQFAQFSPDGRILTCHHNGFAYVWSEDGQLRSALINHKEAVVTGSFSPDRTLIATGSRDNTACLWDTSGQIIQVLSGHSGNVYSCKFSPDSQHLLTRSSDGAVWVWTRAGSILGKIKPSGAYVYDASFSPDGKRVLVASANGELSFWDLKGTLLTTMAQHQHAVKEVQWAPTGELFISRSLDNSVKLWNSQGELIGDLNKHQGEIHHASFNQLGDRILTCSEDRTSILWDSKGHLIQVLQGHRGPIIAAAFSPNNQFILTTSLDRTARLWDYSGNQLMEIKLDSPNPLTACFSHDSRFVLAASANNTSIIRCPTPLAAFEMLSANRSALKPQIEALREKYHIQFLEQE